jgi:hypothetical protein
MGAEVWQELSGRLQRAAGADAELDAAVAEGFGVEAADYTASVDRAAALVAGALPGWRLHLGFGASGVFPYASLANDGTRVVCDAPTVPLAILRAAVGAKARISSLP